MPASSWIRELDKWLSTAGMSHEEVARKSRHDPKYIAKLFAEPDSKPGLGLYLDLVQASGGCLGLAPATTSEAVVETLKSRASTLEINNADLARQIGRDRSVISRLFNGHSPNAGLGLIADLTDTLGLGPQVEIRRRRLEVVSSQVAQASIYELPRVQAVGSGRTENVNPGEVPITGRYMSDELSSHLLEQDKVKSRWVDEANARVREAESQRNEARQRAQAAEREVAAERKKKRDLEVQLARQKHKNDQQMFQVIGGVAVFTGLGIGALAWYMSSDT